MSDLRDRLRGLLALPGPGSAPREVLLNEQARPGGVAQHWHIGGLPATLLHAAPDAPTVLYCHAHGGDYTLGRRELTEGARWLTGPYAPDLLARGLNVLCLDMPGFGERQSEGNENALAKAALWRGQPLMGRMLEDLQTAVTWLQSRSTAPIATLGMSMGAAHAYWLAALDTRIAACAHLCMLADMAPLIETGSHDRHGHFLTVPGLLTHADMGDVAALIAPRPQTVALGSGDHLTPPEARTPALARLRAAYGGIENRLEATIFEADTHVETPAMRAATLAFLERWADAARGDLQEQRNSA
ncbi:alpha/beta fold hydrolase [Primorskyibacter sp. 2E107]|uniref:alpha/beta fold hydrolase n=1 Tax=Primorskyibacter sp. 2E107 TaxID=3403458 RepID=UPI003AF6BDB4